jgi:D-arabinose 1-dehydrogenase-like Zn-dependent alcohol dehydrogenase
MAKMRAVQVKSADGPFETVEREVPVPGPGQVRIKVSACGICHSDSFTKTGHWPGIAYPRVPGHEIAGTVDALGAGVAGWTIGQRAGVGWHGGHCGHCNSCRRGDFVTCLVAPQVPGMAYDGGYADFMIAPQAALARIPDELSDLEAAPLMCAGVTTYNSLRNSGARPSDLVAVLGVGGLGHLGIQFAARMGFQTVAIARGSDKAMTAVIGGLGVGGKLIVLGAADEPLQVPAGALIGGRRSIQGWPSGSSIDSQDTLAFSALNGVRSMNEVFPLERTAEAYERMMSGKARFRVVLTTGSATS